MLQHQRFLIGMQNFYLQMGTSVCKGALQELKKPVAVLTTQGEKDEVFGEERIKFSVSGICRKKLIFRQRPSPSTVAAVVSEVGGNEMEVEAA